MRSLRVVAAVVRRGDAILVTRRPDRPGRPGQWEFPGGKIEPDERDEDALARESARSSAARSRSAGCAPPRTPIPRPRRRPRVLRVRARAGCRETALGVAEIAWARVGTLSAYDFLEADKVIVPEIERLTAFPSLWVDR